MANWADISNIYHKLVHRFNNSRQPTASFIHPVEREFMPITFAIESLPKSSKRRTFIIAAIKLEMLALS